MTQTVEATEIIRGAARRCGMSDRELAETTGICKSTLCDALKHPGNFRLYQLVGIADATYMTDQEWIKLRRGLRKWS